MWQLLLGAAVAGSTSLLANRLFSPNNPFSPKEPNDQLPAQESQGHPIIELRDGLLQPGSEIIPEEHKRDGIFRFSSRGQERPGFSAGRKRSEKRSGGRRVSGRRFYVCLKRRRTAKNADHNSDSCSSKELRVHGMNGFKLSRSGNSVFGWGLGVGIMYMMSTGKAEISRLNSSVDEMTKIVQELRNEVGRRKSSQNALAPTCDNNATTHLVKVGSSKEQLTPKCSNDRCLLNDIKPTCVSGCDDGGCASSVLTDETEVEAATEVPEMDQLEAELESELQKLSGQIDAPTGQSYDNYQCHGVSPFELDQKLCRLLVEQQESQIVELETELHSVQSKLQDKEAELEALKDCVRRLSHFSLHDEEGEATVEGCLNEPDGHESESRKLLVGMKRPINC